MRIILIAIILIFSKGLLFSQVNYITVWRDLDVYYSTQTNQQSFYLDSLVQKEIFDTTKKTTYIVYFGKEQISRNFNVQEYTSFYENFDKKHQHHYEYTTSDCDKRQERDSLEDGLWMQIIIGENTHFISNLKTIKDSLLNGNYMECYVDFSNTVMVIDATKEATMVQAYYKNGFLKEKKTFLENGNLKSKTTYLDSCSLVNEEYIYFDNGNVSMYVNTILGYRINFNIDGLPIQIEEEFIRNNDNIEMKYFQIKEKGIVNDRNYFKYIKRE